MPQLRVSDFTYRYIKDQKMAGESFDDVLTRLLDIEPDLGELTAYMADEQADIFNECVMAVEDAVDVTREMEETQYNVSLNMDATDSGETLIRFVVSEKPTTSNVEVHYRTLQDELRSVGAVRDRNGDVSMFIMGSNGSASKEEFVKTVEKNARRAQERWG
jgi:predicted CopG family antitoxin